ncbi:MAG: hypothetical protein ACKVOT_14220 [Polaromonas sp.]
MSRHVYYPSPIPTTPSRRQRVLHVIRWLVLLGMFALMVAGTAAVIGRLAFVDLQLDNVFMQGMKAGATMCARDV